LAEHRKQTEDYRSQLLSLEAEMDSLKEQNFASKEVLKVRKPNLPNPKDYLSNQIYFSNEPGLWWSKLSILKINMRV